MFTKSLLQGKFVSVLAILAITLVFLFGGSAATVMAAESAIPGDALYGFKTQFENTRISLSGSAVDRFELQLQFAERRLEELKALVAEGRLEDIKSTADLFEEHISEALDELEAVAESDPELAAALLARITDALSRYSSLLDEISNSLPDPLHLDLDEINDFLHELTGDDNDNANANDNEDDDDENGNDANENEDDDEDENDNDANENEDDDDDENDNDANENNDDDDEDNANDNVNANENDNSNSNNNDDNSNDDNTNNDNDNDDDDDDDDDYNENGDD